MVLKTTVMQGEKKNYTQTHEHSQNRVQVTNWIIQHYATEGDRVSQSYHHTSNVSASVLSALNQVTKRPGKKPQQKAEV